MGRDKPVVSRQAAALAGHNKCPNQITRGQGEGMSCLKVQIRKWRKCKNRRDEKGEGVELGKWLKKGNMLLEVPV